MGGTAWDEFLYDCLPSLDLSGKKVAIFGLGDQGSYGDNFCDAAGELYDCFSAQGATMVGMTSPDDYDYSDSKALRDGQFCGLLCDEDNEYDKSEGRRTGRRGAPWSPCSRSRPWRSCRRPSRP